MLDAQGRMYYKVVNNNDTLVYKSPLGLKFEGVRPFYENLEIHDVRITPHTETWKPAWGESNEIENNYTQMTVFLKEKIRSGRFLHVIFRLYNDGVAFRYEVPGQGKLKHLKLTDELTKFQLLGNPKAWWIPVNYVSDEMLYTTSYLSEVDSLITNKKYNGSNELYMENVADTLVGFNTPITMRTEKGTYMSFHEADLTKYSDMKLLLQKYKNGFALKAHLVPDSNQAVKAYLESPFKTPWRILLIADSPEALLTSNLILNVNDKPAIKNTEWCKPIRYIGIWWGYHVGKWSWDYPGTEKNPHGATTENAKKYIDFAAKHGIEGVLVEGWNTFLDTTSEQAIKAKTSGDYPHGLRDYTKGHPDYNFEEVARYAQEKGVQLMVHNETMGAVLNYESQWEKAFAYYQSLGIHYIKVGYAWYIENKKHFHHSQYMVEHYQRLVQLAAKYQINLIIHETIKDTGLRKKYPNLMTRECVRGNEYNAWDKAYGNPPEHETILPFTRGLAGPIDYTPGIFDVEFDLYKGAQRVNTTKAKQLALYVTLYSPVVMAADLIENYEDDPAFEYIKQVPATWDKTLPLASQIGDYLAIARKKGEDWFVGAVTDENEREIELTLDFLTPNQKYLLKMWADADDTQLNHNPTQVQYNEMEVSGNTRIKVRLAQSGGAAMIISPL